MLMPKFKWCKLGAWVVDNLTDAIQDRTTVVSKVSDRRIIERVQLLTGAGGRMSADVWMLVQTHPADGGEF